MDLNLSDDRAMLADSVGLKAGVEDGARGVLVTGGATGIGWATARRFAAGGDRVAILDRDGSAAAARTAELGDDHLAIVADVSDERALVAAIGAARDTFGRIDVLVNNAATIAGCDGPALDLDLAEFDRMMAVNAHGPQVAAGEVIGIMQAQGGGAIVNVASLAGLVAVPGRTAYSSSKAAVIGLTIELARELRGSDVRVNAVLPGFTATETYRSLQRDRGADSRRTERRIPLGRLAEPDEIAAAIHHLAAPSVRATNGLLLSVDGGFGAYGGIDDASPGGANRPEPSEAPRIVVMAGSNSPTGIAAASHFGAVGAQLVLLDDAAGVEAAVTEATTRHGRIDLLVNIITGKGLGEPLIVARAVAAAMIPAGRGAIVNVHADGMAGCALTMLSRGLACEWARHGIRVNAVCIGNPVETVAAIDFLGSDDASYITAASYRVGDLSDQRA